MGGGKQDVELVAQARANHRRARPQRRPGQARGGGFGSMPWMELRCGRAEQRRARAHAAGAKKVRGQGKCRPDTGDLGPPGSRAHACVSPNKCSSTSVRWKCWVGKREMPQPPTATRYQAMHWPLAPSTSPQLPSPAANAKPELVHNPQSPAHPQPGTDPSGIPSSNLENGEEAAVMWDGVISALSDRFLRKEQACKATRSLRLHGNVAHAIPAAPGQCFTGSPEWPMRLSAAKPRPWSLRAKSTNAVLRQVDSGSSTRPRIRPHSLLLPPWRPRRQLRLPAKPSASQR